MTASTANPLPCVFVPPNEPWECSTHGGIRTSLDQEQCDIARPAEPFNDAYLDNIRQAIAEGRNPGSRYTVRRLLATIEADRVRLGDCDDALTTVEMAYERDVPPPKAAS